MTCQCTGCSIEDSKKRKKKVKKRKSSSSESSDDEDDFKTVNGCCKKCMKAFSKKGKEAKVFFSIYLYSLVYVRYQEQLGRSHYLLMDANIVDVMVVIQKIRRKRRKDLVVLSLLCRMI